MQKYNVAIVGATGNVGRATIKVLEERNFPIKNLYGLASQKSIGKKISFGETKEISVLDLETFDFKDIDIVFMCAGSEISKKYHGKIIESQAIIIDKSSYFRMREDVPLIVPEANSYLLKNISGPKLICNPNCCVIPMVVALKPLDNIVKIKRIVASTYQSVSGAGKGATDELYNQTKGKYSFQEIPGKYLDKQIAFNIIPQIGPILDDGRSGEEIKIEQEFSKIMERKIPMSVTCVRVPVFVGHSISLNVEFESSLTKEEAEELLEENDSVAIIRQHNSITPIEVVGDDSVYISRIREDSSRENSLNLWISCDNLLKGAALNSVQIVENILGSRIN
jgi:aspartate-semialdehyde dehydrogenase